MKQSLIIILLALCSCVCFAQKEPGNNLRKNLYELKETFPDVKFFGKYGERDTYQSKEAEVLFEMQKGIVVSEFTSFDGPDGYLQDLFVSLLKSLRPTSRHEIWGNDKRSVSLFYSYFTIYLSYTANESLTLTYELMPKFMP